MITEELDFLKGIVAQIENPTVRQALESSMESEERKEILHPLTQMPLVTEFIRPKIGKGMLAFFE